jgi:CRP-like cAMP-binding protein
MTRTQPQPQRLANELLASLPPAVIDRIVPTIDVVPLPLKQILHRIGEPIDAVYFPGGGFCSILSTVDDNKLIEVATVGREGMVGPFAVFPGALSPSVTMVLAPTDTCYRMAAQDFWRQMEYRDEFYALMMRFANALLGFIMQSTACNAVHTVEQRLARWLLHASDRMGSNDFPLTQEFVAMMLGATRPTVTVVAGTLQKVGFITYRRGRLTILDRPSLESAACECYRIATKLLLGVTRVPRT